MRDLLIYGALFLVWLLFNWIASRAKGAKRARRAAEHARSTPSYATPVPQPAPLDTEWGRAPPAAQPEPARAPATVWAPLPDDLPSYVAAPTPSPAAVRERAPERVRQRVTERVRERTAQPVALARRPRLRSPADLRAAMVLTAVLGPCRAQQDWEPPDRQF